MPFTVLPELAHAAVALIPLDPPAKTKPAKRKPVQAATGPPGRSGSRAGQVCELSTLTKPREQRALKIGWFEYSVREDLA